MEDLKKYVKNNDTQKRFTINVSPKEVSNKSESQELNEENENSMEEGDDFEKMLFWFKKFNFKIN